MNKMGLTESGLMITPCKINSPNGKTSISIQDDRHYTGSIMFIWTWYWN